MNPGGIKNGPLQQPPTGTLTPESPTRSNSPHDIKRTRPSTATGSTSKDQGRADSYKQISPKTSSTLQPLDLPVPTVLSPQGSQSTATRPIVPGLLTANPPPIIDKEVADSTASIKDNHPPYAETSIEEFINSIPQEDIPKIIASLNEILDTESSETKFTTPNSENSPTLLPGAVDSTPGYRDPSTEESKQNKLLNALPLAKGTSLTNTEASAKKVTLSIGEPLAAHQTLSIVTATGKPLMSDVNDVNATIKINGHKADSQKLLDSITYEDKDIKIVIYGTTFTFTDKQDVVNFLLAEKIIEGKAPIQFRAPRNITEVKELIKATEGLNISDIQEIHLSQDPEDLTKTGLLRKAKFDNKHEFLEALTVLKEALDTTLEKNTEEAKKAAAKKNSLPDPTRFLLADKKEESINGDKKTYTYTYNIGKDQKYKDVLEKILDMGEGEVTVYTDKGNNKLVERGDFKSVKDILNYIRIRRNYILQKTPVMPHVYGLLAMGLFIALSVVFIGPPAAALTPFAAGAGYAAYYAKSKGEDLFNQKIIPEWAARQINKVVIVVKTTEDISTPPSTEQASAPDPSSINNTANPAASSLSSSSSSSTNADTTLATKPQKRP